MESSHSQALAKRSIDTALMPPPPAPKRIKRPTKVLDEDSYTDALSHIIARDFFPGLLETEAQQDYLNALDSKDPQWIGSAVRKLSEIMTPGPDGRRLRGRRGTSLTAKRGFVGLGGDTPKGFSGDTPMSAFSESSSASTQVAKPYVDTNMSLSAFQEKYTSEDNESFYKLLDKQNLKKAERYSWVWAGNKIPAARQIAYRKREQKHLDQKAAQEAEDNGKQLATSESSDTRKAMPDTWRFRPDNNFMFPPGSIEDSLQTVQQKAEEESRAPPKAVVYDNTRLPTKSSTADPAIPPSPSLSAIQDANAGRPRLAPSDSGFGGDETPRVNGYKFVDSEPSPAPSEMTSSWDSNMSLLESGKSTPNPFKIKESSKREALHHRMVDKVAKGKRKGKVEVDTNRTPVPKFTTFTPRKTGLTPAGQKLLSKMGGKTPGSGNIWEGATPKVGSGLRAGWTAAGK